MKTLEQINADRLRKAADILRRYKNSRQTSYFRFRAKQGIRNWAKEPKEKVVVPIKPISLCEGSVIRRMKTKPEVGVKIWDCGSRKQSSAILAEL